MARRLRLRVAAEAQQKKIRDAGQKIRDAELAAEKARREELQRIADREEEERHQALLEVQRLAQEQKLALERQREEATELEKKNRLQALKHACAKELPPYPSCVGFIFFLPLPVATRFLMLRCSFCNVSDFSLFNPLKLDPTNMICSIYLARHSHRHA